MSLLPTRFHDATAAAHAGLGAPVNRSLTPSDVRRANAAEQRRADLATFEEFTHEIDANTGEPLPEVRVHPGEPLTHDAVLETIRKVAESAFRDYAAFDMAPGAIAGGVHDSLDKMLERAATNMAPGRIVIDPKRNSTTTGMRLMQEEASRQLARLEQNLRVGLAEPVIHAQTEEAIELAKNWFATAVLTRDEVRAYYKRLAEGKVDAAEAMRFEPHLKLWKREQELAKTGASGAQARMRY